MLEDPCIRIWADPGGAAFVRHRPAKIGQPTRTHPLHHLCGQLIRRPGRKIALRILHPAHRQIRRIRIKDIVQKAFKQIADDTQESKSSEAGVIAQK